MSRMSLIVPCLLIGMIAVPASGEDGDQVEAKKLATRLTEEGAAKFNTADAKAMSAYYVDDAKVFLVSRDESQEVSVKEYNGRQEIEQFYADIFKDHGTIRSKNTVEYSRLLAPDVLVIAGTFEPNLDAEKPLKVPFYQVRVKKGEKWLMISLRIFLVSKDK
jgi:ketosteroid isomerase-like protein